MDVQLTNLQWLSDTSMYSMTAKVINAKKNNLILEPK